MSLTVYSILSSLLLVGAMTIIFHVVNRWRRKHGKAKLSQWLEWSAVIMVAAFLSAVIWSVLSHAGSLPQLFCSAIA